MFLQVRFLLQERLGSIPSLSLINAMFVDLLDQLLKKKSNELETKIRR